MNISGIVIACLMPVLVSLPGLADPIRHRDVASGSPWSAHLDFERLGEGPLKVFLVQVAGFDRILQLQTVFKKRLGVDWASVEGVTLFGAGERAAETGMILRGDFAGVDLTKIPLDGELPVYHGVPLRKGPDWQGRPLILANFSDREWVGGTSLRAVREALDLLAGRTKSESSDGLGDMAANELSSSSALFALDMKKVNEELQFEADFTKAIQRAWFLIGSRDDLVEATLMVESSDREGLLLLLQEHLQFLTMLLKSRPDAPAIWLELAAGIEVETQGNWITVKVAASPGKSALFLKSLGPLFVKAPEPSGEGN